MVKITIWERKAGHGIWVYNHMEDGWSADEKPTPKTERLAEYWDYATWRKFYAYETADGKIINSL